MKIKLLKDFLTHKEGEVIERSEESGNYLIRCKVGVEFKEEVVVNSVVANNIPNLVKIVGKTKASKSKTKKDA